MATTETAETATAWDAVDDVKATTPQRRALYRLGFSRSIVKRMSVADADKAIRLGLQLWTALHGERGSE